MSTETKEEVKVCLAAKNMDWQQVVLSGGPPCFHLCDDGYFCGRAARWDGHKKARGPIHEFVSLEKLLQSQLAQLKREVEALRKAGEQMLICFRAETHASVEMRAALAMGK